MKYKNTIVATSVLALLMSSCAKNETILPDGSDYLTGKPVTITVGAMQTRAGYAENEVIAQGSFGFWLDQNDKKYNTTNLEVKYEADAWMPQSSLLWKNSTDEATFIAAYPYDSDGMYEIIVPTIQTNESVKTAEVLYAKGLVKGADGAVNIRFSHTLAQLKVQLTKAAHLGDVVVESVKITNIKTRGLFIAPASTWNYLSDLADITMIKNSDMEFECLLIPQNLSGYTIDIVATVDGVLKNFHHTSSATLTFAKGATYTMPIQIGKTL